MLGLALGAESQAEFVLESDLEAQVEQASAGAAGNLVILTAILVALGTGGALMLLSRQPVVQRLIPAAVVAAASYGGVLIGQSMWPSYLAFIEARYATLSNSLLAANLPAAPSVLVIPLTLLLATVLVAGWGTKRLLGRNVAPESPKDLLAQQTSATLLAVPFLAVLAWGNVRLLVALPDDQPGLGPYFVVLPAVALACLALTGTALAKTWHLGTFVRNARLVNAVQQTWQTLGRVESALLAVLGGLGIAGTFLPAAPTPDLELGRVLGLTLRGHTQMVVLLAIPLSPLLRVHRKTLDVLDTAPLHAATLDDDTDPLARLSLGSAVASVLLAAIGTWAFTGALWTWLLALAPVVGLTVFRLSPWRCAPLLLLTAFVLWAIGNTVQATYAGGQGSAVLSFSSAPGLLALWRTLGALLAATALARLARLLGDIGVANVPMASGFGLAAAVVVLLEMPLTAWLINRPGVDAIAVGSVVSSLDAPVRAILHTVAAVLAVCAALLAARLHRPDWFSRTPRRPTALVRPKGARPPLDKTPA